MKFKLQMMIECAKQTLADFTQGDLVEFLLLNDDIDDEINTEFDCLGIVVGKDETGGFLELLSGNQAKGADPVLCDPKHVRKIMPVIDHLMELWKSREFSSVPIK